ncbi:hypothetical protein B4N89_40750 [Embleya scabrispora]|uniref:Uncharacterized protein n=1 Tax=Embleya scabrispora TaxID=159449 RepID=A0A1T3NJK6_9ACTN|nr:hypothetical protein [Embleya scabrispora]OPC76928.1 hypothetical protein B4N89_40750 [Embleya scabrispora]
MKDDEGGRVSPVDLLLEYTDAATAARVRVRLGPSVVVSDVEAGVHRVRAGAVALGTQSPPDGVAGPDPGTPLAQWLRNLKTRVDGTALDGHSRSDWDLIAAEHLRVPYRDDIARQLLIHPDCPTDAALVLAAESPGDVTTGRQGTAFSAALDRRLLTARQFALEGRPAWRALGTVARHARAVHAEPRIAPLDRVLDEAARMLPGPDPAAWAWLAHHAPDYPGTFTELCADAASAAGPDRVGAGAPLAGADPHDRDTARVMAQRWGRMTPLGLLGRLPPKDAAAVLAVLPSDVRDVFRWVDEPLPGHLVLALMRNPELDARALVGRLIPDRKTAGVLLARHDRHINAALLFESSNPAIRYAAFVATRRDASPRVRLTAFDRSWLNAPYRDGCLEAVHGHHTALLRAVLRRRADDLGPAGVLRGLLSLWEAQGRGALLDPRLRSLLTHTPATRQARRWALGAPDGLARLRAETLRREQPDELVAAIRARPERAARHVPDSFWPAAAAAHEHDPLPRAALVLLARHSSCPAELLRAAADVDDRLAVELAAGSREHALAALARPLPPASRQARLGLCWFGNALADEVLSVGEFVELGHPAVRLLEALADLFGVFPDGHAEASAMIAEHVRATIAGDPEAWAVAVMLLPDFTGTVPELLATAAAAAST